MPWVWRLERVLALCRLLGDVTVPNYALQNSAKQDMVQSRRGGVLDMKLVDAIYHLDRSLSASGDRARLSADGLGHGVFFQGTSWRGFLSGFPQKTAGPVGIPFIICYHVSRLVALLCREPCMTRTAH